LEAKTILLRETTTEGKQLHLAILNQHTFSLTEQVTNAVPNNEFK